MSTKILIDAIHDVDNNYNGIVLNRELNDGLSTQDDLGKIVCELDTKFKKDIYISYSNIDYGLLNGIQKLNWYDTLEESEDKRILTKIIDCCDSGTSFGEDAIDQEILFNYNVCLMNDMLLQEDEDLESILELFNWNVE